jgi:uncharacterized protein (TIGR03437 family)
LRNGVPSTTPAQPEETIVLYAIGFGPGNPLLPAGLRVATQPPLANTATVQIGGLPASIFPESPARDWTN